ITASFGEPLTGMTFSLTDSANGRFAINPISGVVTVANAAAIDYESSGGSYTITVRGTGGGAAGNLDQNYTITVQNAAPSVPTDSNSAANSVNENVTSGTAVGITASSSDPKGGTITYSFNTGHADHTAGTRFTINPTTGVI